MADFGRSAIQPLLIVGSSLMNLLSVVSLLGSLLISCNLLCLCLNNAMQFVEVIGRHLGQCFFSTVPLPTIAVGSDEVDRSATLIIGQHFLSLLGILWGRSSRGIITAVL